VTPLAPTVAQVSMDLRAGISIVQREGFQAVQLAASGPNGVRPSSMNQSARRDLAVTLRRAELTVAGIDLWIPPHHFRDAATVDRALHAVDAACSLAGELGGCVVCLELPRPLPGDETTQALHEAAAAHGARIAVLGPLPDDVDTTFSVCVDPATWLAAGLDPSAAASRSDAAPRLSDLSAGCRVPPGGEGALDVEAYRIACEIGGRSRPVVADLRSMPSPLQALRAMRSCWA
jgi:hypothetical protein